MDFSIPKNAKMVSLAAVALGILLVVLGLFTGGEAHEGHNWTMERFWSNLLVNSFYFFAIALGALFFLALQYATEAAWATVLKRVFEAFMMYLPVGSLLLIIAMSASTFHFANTYHWMHEDVLNKYVVLEEGKSADDHHAQHIYTNDATVEGAVENHHYDAIIDGKSGYLNNPFFWLRTFVYVGTFIFFAVFFRKRSIADDELTIKDEMYKSHFRNVKFAAVFLVLFAVFSSTMSWDWLMSIDTHWFSTLYGWYVFSGMWVSSITVMLLVTIYLKGKGYMEAVNENHIHDMAKWMFALSFLWSYLWFSQFLLIWYSDIPEELPYYIERFRDYRVTFLVTFFINFSLPMVVMMARPAKRNYTLVTIIGLIIIVGHWLDVYLLIMPGTVHNHGTIGLLEIGMFIAFAGIFIYHILMNLTKAPLMVKNHPYLDESKHHHF